jgi:hypothetical protein
MFLVLVGATERSLQGWPPTGMEARSASASGVVSNGLAMLHSTSHFRQEWQALQSLLIHQSQLKRLLSTGVFIVCESRTCFVDQADCEGHRCDWVTISYTCTVHAMYLHVILSTSERSPTPGNRRSQVVVRPADILLRVWIPGHINNDLATEKADSCDLIQTKNGWEVDLFREARSKCFVEYGSMEISARCNVSSALIIFFDEKKPLSSRWGIHNREHTILYESCATSNELPCIYRITQSTPPAPTWKDFRGS